MRTELSPRSGNTTVPLEMQMLFSTGRFGLAECYWYHNFSDIKVVVGGYTPHFHLRWQVCSSDKPHQRLLQPTVTPENRNLHPLRYRKQLLRASGRLRLAIGGRNGVYAPPPFRWRAHRIPPVRALRGQGRIRRLTGLEEQSISVGHFPGASGQR